MRPSLSLAACVVSALAFTFSACSGAKGEAGFGPDGKVDSGTAAVGDGGPGNPNSPGGGHDGGFGPVGDGSVMTCVPDPANFDIPGNNCDDDGDGKVDNVTVCDTGLALAGPAGDFAKSIGLCQTTAAADAKWGVVSATYTNGHAPQGGTLNDAQHGLLPQFGNLVKPREGKMFGVLSSGYGREFDGDPASVTQCAPNGLDNPGCFKTGVAMQGPGAVKGGAPNGFPKAAMGCPNSNSVHDVVDVKLQIKVPKNAQGLQFDFDFWSGEWPEYVCTDYNDSFIAYLTSKAFNGGAPDNISFDSKKNPVSVNNGFFENCTAATTTGCNGSTIGTSTCPRGTGELLGTGFFASGTWCPQDPNPSSGGGSTGWLTTQAPVGAGEVISLEYIIWDTGDSNYDSSIILDNFQWVPGPVQAGTQRPPQ